MIFCPHEPERFLTVCGEYRKVRNEIARLKELYCDCYPSGTAFFSDMPRAQSDGFRIDQDVARRLSIRDKIAFLKRRQSILFDDFCSMTHDVPIEELVVLVNRYVGGYNWATISDKLGISRQKAMRLRSKGLKMVDADTKVRYNANMDTGIGLR